MAQRSRSLSRRAGAALWRDFARNRNVWVAIAVIAVALIIYDTIT